MQTIKESNFECDEFLLRIAECIDLVGSLTKFFVPLPLKIPVQLKKDQSRIRRLQIVSVCTNWVTSSCAN